MDNNKITRRKGLTYIEKSYIAGFFDGEGCISIYRLTNKKVNCWAKYRYDLQVFVYNNHEGVIKWIQERIGYGRVKIQKRPEGKNWKPNYMLRFSSTMAKSFLEEIVDYTKVKQERAKLAIEFQTFRSSRKAQKRPGTRVYQISEKDNADYNYYWQHLQELNQQIGRVYVPPATSKRKDNRNVEAVL